MATTRPLRSARAAPAEQPDRLSGPALRTFFSIAEAWGLSNEEAMRLLGEPRRSTYFEWKRAGDGRLDRDPLERIACSLGIYQAPQIPLPDHAPPDGRVRTPNPSPLRR